jgi:oxygen-dependent protoporphyrinogen oxidase
MFLRPRDGVGALPAAIAARLADRLRTGSRVAAIAADADAWRLNIEGVPSAIVDGVVLAVPASEASRLLASVAPEAAAAIARIRAVSTGVVLLVYPDGSADALPSGTGFVVPRGAAPFTAVTWLSSKWPDPAFGTRAVLRCFVGADGDEDVLDAPDPDIVGACVRHLTALLPLGDPAHTSVVRWPDAMPQYELGHRERVAAIRAALPAGVAVTGQPYDGVGVADVVRAAGEAATAVLGQLGSGAP